MKLSWLIDVDLIAEEQPDLVSHIKSLGYDVYKLSAALDKPKLINDINHIYAFLGSFQELSAIKKYTDIPIATYGLNHLIDRSGYISYMPQYWFLNEESVMVTWGQLTKDKNMFFNMFNTDKLFVRPNSAKKIFTGQVFTKENIFTEMQFLNQNSSVMPETIIWVGRAKAIEKEYRFWISDRKIAGYSEYSFDKSPLCTKTEPSKIVMDMANQVADYSWQVDRIYTVDITEHLDVAKIVELNSFSCAGLYNCDGKKLLETVSLDILAEWEE